MTTALTTAAFGLAQHSAESQVEAQEAESHFQALQSLMQQVTVESLSRKAHMYSEESTQERKLASALRRQALEISRRECLKDTWVAHSGNVQASLFISTVLIGLGYEILSGAIPSKSWQHVLSGSDEISNMMMFLALLFLFVLTLLSVGFGLVALSLLLARYKRLSQFDFETPWKLYSCGHTHVEMVSYIECRCRWLETLANNCLIVSACCGLSAMMLYSFDKFQNLPNLGDIVGERKEKMMQQNSTKTSTTTTILADPIRDLAAPILFCVIVGATIVAMLVMEFGYLSSDTLQKRPPASDNVEEEEELQAKEKEEEEEIMKEQNASVEKKTEKGESEKVQSHTAREAPKENENDDDVEVKSDASMEMILHNDEGQYYYSSVRARRRNTHSRRENDDDYDYETPQRSNNHQHDHQTATSPDFFVLDCPSKMNVSGSVEPFEEREDASKNNDGIRYRLPQRKPVMSSLGDGSKQKKNKLFTMDF